MARVLTLLTVSLLSAGAACAQTAPPTQASIREVMNRVHGYLLTATPLRPINGATGAADMRLVAGKPPPLITVKVCVVVEPVACVP